MASPTLVKTWSNTYSARTNSGNIVTDNKFIIYNTKVILKTNGWTVPGSCNSSASSMDGTDRWSSTSDLTWANAGTAHSWIVLRQSSIATKFEICIDLSNSSSTNNLTLVISPGNGFGTSNGGTDGSTTARPTATDEIIVVNNTQWNDAGAGLSNGYCVTVIWSSDQTVWRVFNVSLNANVTTWFFEKPKNPSADWTTPWLVTAVPNSGNPLYTLICQQKSYTFFQPTATSPVGNLYFALPSFGNTALYNVWLSSSGYTTNVFTSGWDMLEPLLVSDSPGVQGVWGRVNDLYFSNVTGSLANMSTASDNTHWTTTLSGTWFYLSNNQWWH